MQYGRDLRHIAIKAISSGEHRLCLSPHLLTRPYSMDICRKFLQMGRTRSLRYALRPGGRKYTEGEEMPRTGKIYDQGKLDGAETFKRYEHNCWHDPVYWRSWQDWGGKAFDRPESIAS